MRGHKGNLNACYLSERNPCEKAICKSCCVIPTIQHSGKGRTMGTVKRWWLPGVWGRKVDIWEGAGTEKIQGNETTLGNTHEMSLCIAQNHRMHTTTSNPSVNHGPWMIMPVSADLSPVMKAPFWRGKLKWGRLFMCGSQGSMGTLSLFLLIVPGNCSTTDSSQAYASPSPSRLAFLPHVSVWKFKSPNSYCVQASLPSPHTVTTIKSRNTCSSLCSSHLGWPGGLDCSPHKAPLCAQ